MSYFLIDEQGTTRDLSTNAGLEALRAAAGPALLRLLDAGYADNELREAAAAEPVQEQAWGFVPGLLRELHGAVTLSNGVGEEE